jgi:hypothetical protein
VTREGEDCLLAGKFKLCLIASKAGENSQTNGIEHTIESSILTDQSSRKMRRKNDTARNIFNPAKKSSSTNASQNLK